MGMTAEERVKKIRTEHGPNWQYHTHLDNVIIAAIREAEAAAEQRGAEREREACLRIAQNKLLAMDIVSAIRARGKQELESA